MRLSILCLLIGLSLVCRAEDPRSGSAFYRDSFGVVDVAGYPLANRVDAVFNRLLRVADKAEYKDPELLLVASDNWPWAIALPDNTVVLTRGAVDICYRDVPAAQGDARLAMILGHELGHLAEDDYWHRDVYLSLSARSSDSASASRGETAESGVLRFIGEQAGLVNNDSAEWQTIVRDRELRADDRGYIYAALAGYDTSLLFRDSTTNFFQFWTEQTTSGAGQWHLSPTDRAAYLNARAATLEDIAELFHLGVALVHLGNLEPAEQIFRKVLTAFPAHEVYNNLGYIRLQQSLDHLAVNPQDLFWFPSTVDSRPQSSILSRNIATAMQDPAQLLDDAIQYFQLAIRQNPAYLTGYLNLSTAYFYRGRYNSAAAILADAREVSSNNPEIELLWQIAMLNSLGDSVDYLPVALSSVTPLAANAGNSARFDFNLAQLLEQASRPQQATALWKQLSENVVSIPEPYRTVVGMHFDVASSQPVTPGSAIDDYFSTDAETAVAAMSDRNRDLSFAPDESGLQRIESAHGGWEYVSGNQPLLRIHHRFAGKSVAELKDCCGAPQHVQDASQGEVWRYNDRWAVLVEGHTIREVWENTALAY